MTRHSSPVQPWRHTVMRVETPRLSYLFSGGSLARGRMPGREPSEYLTLELAGPFVLSPSPKWVRGEVGLHQRHDAERPIAATVTEWIGHALGDSKTGILRADIWISPAAFQAVISPCLNGQLPFVLMWGPPMKYRRARIKSVQLEREVVLEDL